MLHFSTSSDRAVGRNGVCPFDLTPLSISKRLDVIQDNRCVKVQTYICTVCRRRFISVEYFPDLQVIGINKKDYINLNLPKGEIRIRVPIGKDSSELPEYSPNRLGNKILSALKVRQPQRPQSLSKIIGENWKEVKDCLYNDLGDKVYRDEEYYWWVKDVSLHWTHEKIYFLTNYVQRRFWKYRTEDSIYDSKLILSLKDGDPDAIEEVGKRMLDAVNELTVKYVSTKHLLLAVVPSSKTSRMSWINNVANYIAEKADFPGNTYAVNMFERIFDLPAAHEGFRPDYEIQKASIRCNTPQLCAREYTCFILDDITTTGTMMNVCRDILIENGMPEENIIRLAFARTGG